MRWGNGCWFAVRQWQHHGGFVVLTRSRYGWWWHAQWTDDFHYFLEFVPDHKRRARRVPPIWFRGYVRMVKR